MLYLLLGVFLFAPGQAIAQTSSSTRITLKMTHAKLITALEEIKKQSGFSFIYNEKLVTEVTDVTVDLKEVSLDSALNAVLKGTGLTYRIQEKIILLEKKKTTTTQISAKTISGTVKDERGEPLPGVSVLIKGTVNGVSTDAEGNFKLNAGLRFDYEFIRLCYNSDCSTSYTIYRQNTTDAYSHRDVEIHNKNSLKKDFMQLLPKVSVAFTPNNTLEIYASAAKGYKAGGFNTQMFSDVLQQELMSRMGIGERYDVERVVGYEPEKSWNYEIGIHGKWDDIRLFADIAAFYISCHDQQLTVFPEGDVTGRVMANAGKTRSAGAEISVRYTPVERLDISLGYGYTNAKFVEFNNGKQDYSGNFIPYAPQNTIFATANYALKTNATAMPYIAFGARVHGAGKIYWNEENSASQNFYARLDANVRFSFKRFSIDFWAKNITRTQYRTFYFVSIQHEFYQRGKPSTFGATLKISI